MGDVCAAGTCHPGAPADCDDGDACTADSCDAEVGCTHAPTGGAGCCVADVDCDDGVACTFDVCLETSCTSVADPKDPACCTGDGPCNDGDPCTVEDSCSAFVCHGADKDCDDGDPCTEGDACVNGTCKVGGGLVCDDGNACTDDTCLPGLGCAAKANALPCDDGNPCTTSDACAAKQCAGGPPPSCDDADPCTKDVCVASEGCVHAPTGVPGCCTKASQCDDADACTVDTCKDAACQHLDACCKTDAECDDGDDVCTTDKCVAGACKHAAVAGPGCCSPVLYQQTFEGGLGDWTVQGGPECTWQVVSGAQSMSPPASLWYGKLATKNYDCGYSTGSATSASIQLPDHAGLELEFDVWLDVEKSATYDKVSVEVAADGWDPVVRWDKGSEVPMQTWVHLRSPLDAFQGKTIAVIVRFDTADSALNGTEGVYFDNIRITQPCP